MNLDFGFNHSDGMFVLEVIFSSATLWRLFEKLVEWMNFLKMMEFR